jgi:hypothetical protein
MGGGGGYGLHGGVIKLMRSGHLASAATIYTSAFRADWSDVFGLRVRCISEGATPNVKVEWEGSTVKPATAPDVKFVFQRDGRDFQSIPGARASGTGYGYVSSITGWGAAAGYSDAVAVAADGASTDYIVTHFDSNYFNENGTRPTNHITSLDVTKRLSLWAYVKGEDSLVAHSFSIGTTINRTLTAINNTTAAWRQIGGAEWDMGGKTIIKATHINNDQLVNGIVAIDLMPEGGLILPGQPGLPEIWVELCFTIFVDSNFSASIEVRSL